MHRAPLWAWMLGLVAAPALADELLLARRLEAPAFLDGGAALQARQALAIGSLVSTGSSGRISLQAAGGGTLLLGGDGRLRFAGGEPPDPPGRAALLHLQLEAGAVHVDARKPDGGAPGDVRLAQRHLQSRLYGADAWAETSAAGDELCLLGGAAEVQTPSGHERLDEPGECLRWTARGGQRLGVAEVGSLAPRLARTRFADDYAARYAAEQAQRDGSARPSLAEQAGTTLVVSEIEPAPTPVARPASAPPTAAAARSPARGGEWRIVLASLPDAASAQRATRQWRARGYAADTVLMRTNGKPVYRVLAGHHATRDAAQRSLAKVRRDPPARQAWIVRVPAAG